MNFVPHLWTIPILDRMPITPEQRAELQSADGKIRLTLLEHQQVVRELERSQKFAHGQNTPFDGGHFCHKSSPTQGIAYVYDTESDEYHWWFFDEAYEGIS